ncbi:MAG: alginate export family protein [Gammaproteobacteria bacterium]|jgi:hypothetical protein|nr:alginate export family protein [Gammaproteobacteria bacterium]
MNTSRKLATLPAGLLSILITAAIVPAQAAESGSEAFTKGKPGVAFRYRFENVYQDDFSYDATASTLRVRLNFKTDDYRGFGLFVEGDYVMELGWNDYNAGAGNTPDRTQYPVVADPEGADLNQAYIQWKGDKGTLLRGGRERIIYDNARFVGNVGWRQNEQTYDGVYFQQKTGGFDFQGAWVDQVNRIFGNDVPAGQHDNNTWLLNGAYSFDKFGKLTGYYYDINNKDAAAFSTTSYGIRFNGKYKVDALTLGYGAEYARQSDAHNNPVDFSANYYRIDFSAGFEAFTPYVGYEVLGGDDNRSGAAFRTPLATLHAFNGWADKFLATPDAGLKDFFIGAKGKLKGLNWNVLYHDFNAESGSGSFGSEVDASIGRKFAKNYGLLFKVAFFNSDPGSTYADTTKLWIQLTAGF